MAVEDFVKRIKAKLQREKNQLIINKSKELLKTTDFTIISQNCIGGVFYHDMGLRFNSPTINLFFSCPDFVKFVLNLDYYLSLDLKMTWLEEYPIGYLDDVAIHFMHYESCTQAKEKWEERKQRIDWDDIVILCTDMEEFTDEVYSEWKKITYPKILFTANKSYDSDSIYFPSYDKNGKVSDLIPKREFYKDGRLITIINDL